MAMTADGKITTVNRAVESFSSRRDREHLLELRATADAVMSGARTADLNPVNLGPGGTKYRRLRLRHGLSEYNLRVIVSGSATVNPAAEVFHRTFSPVVVLTTRRAPAARLRKLRAVGVQVKICGDHQVDFRRALAWLRTNWRVKRLLCEGGGELNDCLFRASLVNELHLTVCPRIFGGRTAPTISDGLGSSRLPQTVRLKLQSARRHGDEMFFIYRVRAKKR